MAVSERTTSYLIGRVDRLTRTALADALEDSGVTVMDLTVLSVLAARPGLSNARLARRSLVTPQAMHKVISALADRGLVERQPDADGGRPIEVHVTAAGRALLERVEPLRRRAEDRVLGSLTPEERRTLDRLLGKVARIEPALPRE